MERPLSPHLQIYKLPLAAILSIVHRVTGAYLYFGLVLVVWWYYCAVFSSSFFLFSYVTTFIQSFFGKVLLCTWVFSFFFHIVSGIRHLVWDLGIGLSLNSTRVTNLVVIFLSLIFTFIAIMAIL